MALVSEQSASLSPSLPSLAATIALIEARRTNLRINADREVDPGLLAQLCALAAWAPNHHLTEPWRFAIITGEARAELGRRTADYMISGGMADDERLAKVRGKYLRAPVMVMVGCASAADAPESVRVEDRDAVASGVQNMLLGATADGKKELIAIVDGYRGLDLTRHPGGRWLIRHRFACGAHLLDIGVDPLQTCRLGHA